METEHYGDQFCLASGVFVSLIIGLLLPSILVPFLCCQCSFPACLITNSSVASGLINVLTKISNNLHPY